MKTIYLKSASEATLKTALKNIFPEWDQIHMDIPTNGSEHGVYLGLRDGFYLANLLVADDYSNAGIAAMVTTPVSPIHEFAI